jgi:hypothetical protein
MKCRFRKRVGSAFTSPGKKTFPGLVIFFDHLHLCLIASQPINSFLNRVSYSPQSRLATATFTSASLSEPKVRDFCRR